MSCEVEITAKTNSAEILQEWESKIEDAKKVKVECLIGARTDLGRIRENNEDKYEFFQPDDIDILALKGSFYGVADGMGGHSAGQIASELALKNTIASYYADDSPLLIQSIKSAISQANGIIYETARAISERAGMGTTITALVIRGEQAYIAQVGDSRCYLLRDKKIRQITEDHSWVQEQIKRGALTKEEALSSPYKNVITRSLGNTPSVDIDVFELDIEEGDKFLLCSDGLSGLVFEEEMQQILIKSSPSQASWELVNLALDRGGNDNVTVLIVEVKDIIKETKVKKKRGLFGI